MSVPVKSHLFAGPLLERRWFSVLDAQVPGHQAASCVSTLTNTGVMNVVGFIKPGGTPMLASGSQPLGCPVGAYKGLEFCGR